MSSRKISNRTHDARLDAKRCTEGRPSSHFSAGVSQTRRDAVDRGGQRIIQMRRIFAGTLAAEEFHLNQAKGINIRIAQTYGTVENGIGLKQAALTSYREYRTQTAFELLQQH